MECEIEIDEVELRIKDLKITDEEVVDYYRDMEKDAACQDIAKALRMGTTAIKSMKVTEKVDYIKKEFNKMDYRMEKSLDETLEELEEYVGEDGKLPEKIQEFFGEDGKIVKELFDPNEPGTPLNQLKRQIVQTMIELIKEEERERSKPTEIGEDFEDFVEDNISETIKLRKDCSDKLRDTSTERGLKDTTTGDFVVDVEGRENCRLVIEVKDHQTISGPKIQSNMEKALENRDASYGLFINKNVEGLPNYMGYFQDYPKDNYVVCALSSEEDDILHQEMLHTAYQWARTKTLYEEAEAEGIDVSSIQEGMTEVKEGIDKVTHLRKKYTLVEDSIEDMRDITTKMETKVESALNRIQNELEKAVDSA